MSRSQARNNINGYVGKTNSKELMDQRAFTLTSTWLYQERFLDISPTTAEYQIKSHNLALAMINLLR